MRWSSLDTIVKGLLIKQGKPIHFYMQYLKYACDAVRELNFDTLRSIHCEELTVTEYKAIILPCKFVDWVRVGVKVDDKVKRLAQSTTLNRLNAYDDEGNKIPIPNTVTTDETIPAYSPVSDYWYNNNRGGIFNNRPDWSDYKFKYLPERSEIQFNNDFPYETVVLEYIGDGMDGDAATQVDTYAIDTIESYIAYQYELHNRNSSIGVIDYRKNVYDKAHRILRARKSGLSREDILDSVRKGYSATYKN